MSYINIDDARFLFSALIQALPTMISLSLIAIFWLRPERGYFKQFFNHILWLILLFYIVIIGDIGVLLTLDWWIKNNDLGPLAFLAISCFSIIYLIYFLLKYVSEVYKSLINNEKPSEQKSIEILKLRYATGELTKKQFTQMKKDIS
jgi:hypothetical protein